PEHSFGRHDGALFNNLLGDFLRHCVHYPLDATADSLIRALKRAIDNHDVFAVAEERRASPRSNRSNDELRATVIFYDEKTRQIQLCTVYRNEIKGAIDRQIARGSAMNLPLGSDDPTAPLTDETLRQIGGMAVLNQASVHPELRDRLQISLQYPVNWTSPKPAAE
ncbi:hypothetical protein, partial [Paraburkholderia sp.]|uniref:hypothetical protein n=1 Tax=Paraburkholderia sp. TaxID=1926495 RepID=UPI0039E3E29E